MMETLEIENSSLIRWFPFVAMQSSSLYFVLHDINVSQIQAKQTPLTLAY